MACACGGTCSSCRGTLVSRLQPRVDKLRQRFTTFGLRVYDVYLVWTRWGGTERGEGHEVVLAQVPIVPRPKIRDLTSVALNPYTAGLLPVGSVMVEDVTAQLLEEHLTGVTVPPRAYLDGCGSPRYGVFPGFPPDVLGRTAQEQIGRGSPTVRDRVEEPYEFFYEIVEDDRPDALRRRFRLAATPFKDPGKFTWRILLERQSEDRDRHGHSQAGPDHDD